ncbi:MAG TPA: SpoIIE family protein phosphatase [Spirochaetota bacterium]|nr:SpoIIE family protein phosphatase [Spirochaetota bacterium]HNT09763.1 SpoIIE family protein phosphatase [Spirochaetota bacterium]
MKIKYKFIGIFLGALIAIATPLSLFIINQQEHEHIALLHHHGTTVSRILAQSALTILLMNAGRIDMARVDATEMIATFAHLRDDGLLYADIVMVSSRPEINGAVLSKKTRADHAALPYFSRGRISPEETAGLLDGGSVRETQIDGVAGTCYVFASGAGPRNRPPLCVGRLVFSKDEVLRPVARMRRIITTALGAAVFVLVMLGIVLGNVIAAPVMRLTRAAERIERGDYTTPVRAGGSDELATLSAAFNHMSGIITQKIDELERTNRKLTELDRLKDEFLANTTHELRTPLNGIIGIAESLVAGAAGPVSDDLRHDLDLIIASGRRLNRLVGDILDFSKLRNNDFVILPAPLDLFNAAQFVISILRPLAVRKGLVLVNDVSPSLPPIMADENRLQQILLNVVGNAVKFTDEGSVTVSATPDSADPSRIAISVADTGIGIAPEQQSVIFDAFRQADGTTARRQDGAGLGLAIVKHLVELHGGAIRIESEPGRGATFIVTLPVAAKSVDDAFAPPVAALAEAAPLDADIRRPVPGAEDTGKTIMVIDDDPVNLQVIINHLALEGYRIASYHDGVEAYQRIEEGETPDLMLVDVMLPVMSGYELCRLVRRSHTMYELPIVMLTAKNRPEDVVTGIEAGANDYLTKPVQRDELIARVKNLIALRDSVREHGQLERIRYQLEIATAIQKAVLPQRVPECGKIRTAVRYRPAVGVGGDLYDFFPVDNARMGVLIADVSGHGIPAAIIGAKTEMAFSIYRDNIARPAELMATINRVMTDHSYGQFITACYLYIDLEARAIRYSNAGHKQLLVYRARSSRLEALHIKGAPLGLSTEYEYRELSLAVERGDRIILITDGIPDTRNHQRELFGDERLGGLITQHRALPPEGLADAIFAALDDWKGAAHVDEHDDDATLIILDIDY